MSNSARESLNILSFNLKQKALNKFAQTFMPYLGYLFFSDKINTFIWRSVGVKVGKNSIIRRGTHINVPHNLNIGEHCTIHGKIKCRKPVNIGNFVEFVEDVTISTQKHNIQSELFENIYNPIIIEDECWLSLNSVILDGITLKKGSIIAAGAIVSKGTEPWGVYGGVPAKKIGERTPINRFRLNEIISSL